MSKKLRSNCQAWLDEGWERWTKTKPHWFDDWFKRTIAYHGYVVVGGEGETTEGDGGEGGGVAQVEINGGARKNSRFVAKLVTERVLTTRKKSR